MTGYYIEFFLIGLTGGLMGIFYRNCLKVKYMIFHGLYIVLKTWVKKSREEQTSPLYRLLGFIAYPLGFCIYCSTAWITIFLYIIYLSSWMVLPVWQNIVIGLVMALGTQHIVVAIACRFLIYRHPDLDTDLHRELTNKQQ